MSLNSIKYDQECLQNYLRETSKINERLYDKSIPEDFSDEDGNKYTIQCKLPNNRNYRGVQRDLINDNSKLQGLANENLSRRILGSNCSYDKSGKPQESVPYNLSGGVNFPEADECNRSDLNPRYERLTNPSTNIRGTENGFSNFDLLCEDPQATFWAADSKIKCATNMLTQLEAKGRYICDSSELEADGDWLSNQEKLNKNQHCCIINGKLHTLPNGNLKYGASDCN